METAPKTASAQVEISHDDERSKEEQEQVMRSWKSFWNEQQQVEVDKRQKKAELVRKVSEVRVRDNCGASVLCTCVMSRWGS
jgi:hypothetical protein